LVRVIRNGLAFKPGILSDSNRNAFNSGSWVMNIDTKKKHLLFIFVMLCLLSLPQKAFARYLTIDGSSTISASVSGENVSLRGSYTIDNKGDENARNVFPAFRLGGWEWAGDARKLTPSGSETWQFDVTFPATLLTSNSGSSAAIEALPNRGQFPLFVQRHYSDENGAPFSAVEIVILSIGQLTTLELSVLNIPQIAGSSSCDGSGKTYACRVIVRNLSQASKKLVVDFFTSRELSVKSSPASVIVEGRKEVRIEGEIDNFTGVIGSSYAVYALLQWEENGLRRNAMIVGNVKIKEIDYSVWIICGTAFSSFLLMLLIYLFVYKPPVKKSLGK
jgi:hypothetical protein